ncbi:MAG: hypothetical protein GXY01_06030 [Clostridiales bacterium]|nr:hypothetical protein [Clostridiales bacterium]
MNKLLRILLPILLTASIILLAAWLPKEIFKDTYDELDGPKAMDKESPVGIMRSKYLARALCTSERFLYEDEEAVNPEQRAEILQTLFDFFSKIGVPEFFYAELETLNDSAVIGSMSINTKGGAKLPVIHIYLEWEVFWSNWLEAYIDADTGKILYLYISGSCIDNTIIQNKSGQKPTLDVVTAVFGEHTGYIAQGVEYSTNPNENAVIVRYSDGTAEAEYKINNVYYEGTMYDLKIMPLP